MNPNGDRINYITGNENIMIDNVLKPTMQPDSIRAQFRHTMAKYVSFPDEPETGAKVSAKTAAQSAHQLMEKMRIDAAAMRLQFITALLQEDKKDVKQYDVQGKCMDIARRIMRGKKVSAEEMRFLMQNDPGLHFMAILLRQPDNAPDENGAASDVEGELLSGSLVAENTATRK